MIFIEKVNSGGKMFGKLQQCIGRSVFIKFWHDGKVVFYQGILDRVVDYKYIVLDQNNYLLFLATNGAIASIKCDDEIVYETPYVSETYEPIREDIEGELTRRELICFDDNYKSLKSKSTKEYFLKRGKELLNKSYYSKWEEYVEENIEDKWHIVKAVVDIVDKVYNGGSYYLALVAVLGDTFDFSVDEIDAVNEVMADFFADSVYEHTDYAIFMLHFAGIKKMEERQNMKQLMNTDNVYVSLAK